MSSNGPLEAFRSDSDGKIDRIKQFAKSYVETAAYLAAGLIAILGIVVVSSAVYFSPIIAGAFLELGYYPWEILQREAVVAELGWGWVGAQLVWAFLFLVFVATVSRAKGAEE